MKDYQNPEVLRKLYWKEGHSQVAITQKLGISEDTVRKWMRIFNIPVRQRERNDISKELLEELYWKRKLSVGKTSKLVKASPTTIKYKMKKYNIRTRSVIEANTKYIKVPFSGYLKEKAYLLGFRTGDLAAIKVGRCVRVIGGTTHPAQVNLFNSLFEKYSKTSMYKGTIKSDGRKMWVLSCVLDNSFEFLVKKLKKIPNWIFDNHILFYAFLAGYADAEGSWILYRKNHGNGYYEKRMKVRFQILSGDKIILKELYKKLKFNDFDSKFRLSCKKGYHKSNKDLYVLLLDKQQDCYKLAKILLAYSLHKEKTWKMKFLMKNLDKNWDEIKDEVKKFKQIIKDTRLNNDYIKLPLPFHRYGVTDEA